MKNTRIKNTKRVSYNLTLKQLEFLEMRSSLTGLTKAELVRRAVDLYKESLPVIRPTIDHHPV